MYFFSCLQSPSILSRHPYEKWQIFPLKYLTTGNVKQLPVFCKFILQMSKVSYSVCECHEGAGGLKYLDETDKEGRWLPSIPILATAYMSPMLYLDLIKPLWSELRGDIESACQVLTLIDPPLDSWHRLQDKLGRGWWGKRVTGVAAKCDCL